MPNYTAVLLDIEGTTSSISFVHDVMFPYVSERLEEFLTSHFDREDVVAACNQVAIDAGHESLAAWCASHPNAPPKQLVEQELRRLIAADAKATGLKALQGLIWDGGFRSGNLKAHVFPDVIPAIERWRSAGIDVRIYSSGSIAAQKLFFGHLDIDGQSNRLDLLTGHYDTTIGGKKQAESYVRLCKDWGKPAGEILFISDIAEELLAAQKAGFQVLASVRPGNRGLPADFPIASITSMLDIPT